MTNESKTKLRSTLAAIIGAIIAFGPDLLEAIGSIDHAPKWVTVATKSLGFVVALCTSGKGVALLNFFLPDAPKPPTVPPAAVVLLVAAGALVLASPARADTPISKCWSSICAEPQVSVSVVQYNLASHKIGAGLLPIGSVGYGVRDVNDYVAAGLYLSASIGGSTPNYLAPAVLVRFMRAITVGAQVRVGEDVTQWSLLAGGGFGL